jgi:23S rRNA U2552 (ribose-2'-O)-methylase RlmE/FtsJ
MQDLSRYGLWGFLTVVGEGSDEYIGKCKEIFERVKVVKPAASRKASREVYVIGIGRKI